jgi:hypothetical protein
MRTRKVSNTFNLANQNPKDESWWKKRTNIGIGGGGIKESDGGDEFKYNMFDIL